MDRDVCSWYEICKKTETENMLHSLKLDYKLETLMKLEKSGQYAVEPVLKATFE